MNQGRPPRAWGAPSVDAVIRSAPEDFQVHEQLGFELSGDGEHAFLQLQKRNLNTLELQQRISRLSGIEMRDIGLCGLKDRNAVTRQWFSVRLAGRPEPSWQALEDDGDVQVLEVGRHLRKLKRGVHRANRFILQLRQIQGDRAELELRLQQVAEQGVPNYFGEQRFGRGGSTLQQALSWQAAGGRKITRTKRSLFLSALRSSLFNTLLAQRVEDGSWNQILAGDVCMLQGSRSHFACPEPDDEIQARVKAGDIHPGLPLWGRGQPLVTEPRLSEQAALLASSRPVCDFLEKMDLTLSYRSGRMLADDFSWQFCDDDSLSLAFSLHPGCYATAVLSELVNYN